MDRTGWQSSGAYLSSAWCGVQRELRVGFFDGSLRVLVGSAGPGFPGFEGFPAAASGCTANSTENSMIVRLASALLAMGVVTIAITASAPNANDVQQVPLDHLRHKVASVHPRPYGAFTRKLRLFALDDSIISLPFGIRGMTSLPATFLRIPERGLLTQGLYADIAVFDVARMRDRATFDNPHQYSEGTVHVIVNGQVAFRDGAPTGVLAGRPIRRGGRS